LAKLDINRSEIEELSRQVEEVVEEYEDEAILEKTKGKWSTLEKLVGSEPRVKQVATDLVYHFEKRLSQIEGKAMVVGISREVCVRLYNAITELRPEWHKEDPEKGEIKVVMTGSASDPELYQPHIHSKRVKKRFEKRFKDSSDSLKMVIVCDMWLTGFDAPCCHTMYVDKPMRGHNLMQAIARVNRVFRDKQGGLIVDYIGIADSLKEALKQYTEKDRSNTGIDTSQAVAVMLEKYEVIQDILYKHDYHDYQSEKQTERMKAVAETMDFVIGLGEEDKKAFIQTVTELVKAFSLCATEPEAQELNAEIGFLKAVKAGLMKLIAPESRKKTSAQVDAQLNQLVSQSVISEDVVDIYESLGLENPDISILSDQFLEDVQVLPQK